MTGNQRCEKYTSVKKGLEKSHLDFNDLFVWDIKDFELLQI